MSPRPMSPTDRHNLTTLAADPPAVTSPQLLVCMLTTEPYFLESLHAYIDMAILKI